MLTATQLKSKGFGADHLFEVSESGAQIATLNESKFTFEHGGECYTILRKSVLPAQYVLNCAEADIVTVTQTPLLNKYTMQFEGKEWVLKAEGILAQKFGLFESESRVGGVSAGGYFSRFKGITGEFPEELPMPIQLFLLLILIWKWSDTSS